MPSQAPSRCWVRNAQAGLAGADVLLVRRAGLVHDIGRVAVPVNVWAKPAADCYQAMREPRAHRPALSPAAAAGELSREADGGRLAPEAVHAVLAAAGQPRRPLRRPAGLSERECEVLGLLARGLATKQVARRLGISPKTCDHHIQRLYGKAGVTTRAGATLFALEHGLVSPD